MKKFIHKIQDLSQKAAHWKQVLEAAPGQAAQLRETVLMTAGQLQQLRQDVQSNVNGLRADNDARMAQALREVHDSARTFLEAGYALTGVDMDLSPVQRLIVHLEKLEPAPEATLRSLLASNSGRPTTYAILSALIKADAVSEKMHTPHFSYRELIVHIGPTPSVRLCWRADELIEAPEPIAAPPRIATMAPTATVASSAPPPMPSSPSAFTQSSFFEQRSPGATPRATAAASVSEPAATVPATATPTVSSSTSGYHTEAPPGGDWKQSALERFKKMPDGSKYRR